MPTAMESQTPPAEPAAGPRSVRGRRFFRILSGAAWGLVLLLAGELACRAVSMAVLVCCFRMDPPPLAVMREDDRVYGEWLAHAEPPPIAFREEPGYDDSPWLANGALDPNRAAASRGVLFELNGNGDISSLTCADEPPEIRQAGAQLAAAGRLDALLEPEQAEHLRRFLEDSDHNAAEYMLSPGDGPRQCFEAAHYVHPSGAGRWAVLLRLSRYSECMRAYRPHAYRRNWYSGDFLRSEFWTNSLGWRDREIALPKPAGLYRIVFIGGSTAVEGPHNDLTCAKYLERMCAREFGPERVEVINAGVDALTTYGSLERMDDYLALQPDMIVHYNFVNEAASVVAEAVADDFPGDAPGTRVRRLLAKSLLARLAAPGFFYPGEAALAGQVDRLVLGNLRAMADRCDRANVRFVVTTFARPDPAQLSLRQRVWLDNEFLFRGLTRVSYRQYAALADLHNRLLREWADTRGIPCVPTAEEVGGAPDLFCDICHMHLRGIERKAESLFRHLRGEIPGQASGGAR